jgi:predicted short-subunit dehydrogenase-like oxidoreductase (DUF2520 family)
MTKPLPFGLIAEGETRFSHVLQLPRLGDTLGPVKSGSRAQAVRLCNFLRAGYAVSEYEELQKANAILIRVPDDSLPRVFTEVRRAGLPLSKVSFILCESWLSSDALDPLREAGATVATLMSVPSAEHRWFIVEGEGPAVRHVKRFIEQNGARVLEIATGAKPLYFAAELMAITLPLPLLLAAQQALRAAGITGNAVGTLSEQMGQEMFGSLIKGARMIWGSPLSDCPPEVAAAHLESLRQTHPDLAEIIDGVLPHAQRVMMKYRPEHPEHAAL